MPDIQLSQVGDLVQTTLRGLSRGKWTDIASRLQRHIAVTKIIKASRVTIGDAGYEFQWDVMTDQNGSARFVGVGAPDVINVKDVMIQAQVPWRRCTWNWSIDGTEQAVNQGPARIIELVKTRRIAAMISFAELLETKLWRAPASTDVVSPYGIPYWIVKSNTEGFNGTVPSGYTTVGAVNPTTYTAWANWTNQYTAVSKDDLIAKWWKAATFTDFEPAVEGIPGTGTADEYGFYTTYNVYQAMKQQLEAQNDDLGDDVDSQEGKPLFRGAPIVWTPRLEDDTTNPVYGINWGQMKTAIVPSWWMKETHIPVYPGQHTLSATHLDAMFNWFTYNRRRHFVLATDTTLPA